MGITSVLFKILGGLLWPPTESSNATARNRTLNTGFKELLLNVFDLVLFYHIYRTAKHFDVIYMSKVRSLRFIRNLKKHSNARLVLDFGDAIWLNNRKSNRLTVENTFDTVLQIVDAVTTDNELTAEYARQFNSDVTVIPDYPQTESFAKHQRSERVENDPIIIGWIGSPNTAYNLFEIWEALEKVFSKNKNIHLLLVGTGEGHANFPEFEQVKYTAIPIYTQEQMFKLVTSMDIGLFPLQDVESSRVRGILKACIYMSAKVPVVASPVGQVKDFILNGQNGLLAHSTRDWVDAIERLVLDKNLRRKLAENGFDTVTRSFSINVCFSKLRQVLFNENK
ncbi:MAG: glycosyltransferase [Bdellovibrionales bacterium]|nr:glycosyltransferase [Bdellovibrionales bacterium]